MSKKPSSTSFYTTGHPPTITTEEFTPNGTVSVADEHPPVSEGRIVASTPTYSSEGSPEPTLTSQSANDSESRSSPLPQRFLSFIPGNISNIVGKLNRNLQVGGRNLVDIDGEENSNRQITMQFSTSLVIVTAVVALASYTFLRK